MKKILALPGDGIGPSMIESAIKVIEMSVSDVEIIRGDIGFSAYEASGQYLPYETLDLLPECENIICGPVRPGKDEHGVFRDPMEMLKVQMDLYATVRCFRSLADDIGVNGIDVTLWASNTTLGQDVVETQDIGGVTLNKYIRSSSYSRMMARALSDLEMSGKGKATCITRDDLFPESSAMFSESFDALFDPSVYKTEHDNIQRWASKVVRRPCDYEFVVCADLYSHVAAGILAGLTGGNHLSPIGYVGDSNTLLVPGLYHTFDNVEIGTANPKSAISAGAMALFNMGYSEEAMSIIEALKDAYASNERTSDFGGTLSTEEFTDCVLSRI